MKFVVEEVKDLLHRPRGVGAEERGVRGDAKTLCFRSLNRCNSLVESTIPVDRLVVAFLQAVDVDNPRKRWVGLELVELPFEQQCVGAQVHETFAVQQCLCHLVDIGVEERFTTRYGDHRRPAFFDGGRCLFHRKLLAEDFGRVLDLAATVALEVAVEQRFELDYEGVLVPLGEFLARDISTDLDALAQGHTHLTDLQHLTDLHWKGERNTFVAGRALLDRGTAERGHAVHDLPDQFFGSAGAGGHAHAPGPH